MNGVPIPNMMDSLDFVKKLWSGMGIPNAVTPTTDLNELDKRIADLRTVEQWLQLNLTMLRTTIQGLEVQRGTIATLKAFSSNLSSSFSAPGNASASSAAASSSAQPEMPSPAAAQSFMQPMMDAGLAPTAWWNMLSSQFNKIAQAAASGAQEQEPSAEDKKEAPARDQGAASSKAAPKKRTRPQS